MTQLKIPFPGCVSRFPGIRQRKRDAIYPMESVNIPFFPIIPKRNTYSRIREAGNRHHRRRRVVGWPSQRKDDRARWMRSRVTTKTAAR